MRTTLRSSAGTSCLRSRSRARPPRSPAGRRRVRLRVIDSEAVAADRIAERLAGKRLLLTGVTGFVGEALLERILHDLPDTSVVVGRRARRAGRGGCGGGGGRGGGGGPGPRPRGGAEGGGGGGGASVMARRRWMPGSG